MSQCEVCQAEEAVGVACIPGIPMSVGYGRRCLAAGADPYWALRANVICCGGIDAVRPDYLDHSRVWLNGEYVSLRDALTRYPITEAEMNAGPWDDPQPAIPEDLT